MGLTFFTPLPRFIYSVSIFIYTYSVFLHNLVSFYVFLIWAYFVSFLFFFDSVNDLKRPNTVHKTVNTDSYLILPFFLCLFVLQLPPLLSLPLLVLSLFSFLPLLILRLVLLSVFHHNRTRVYDNDYVFLFFFFLFFLFLFYLLFYF